MNKKNFLLLVVAYVGCTVGAAQSDMVGNEKLPVGAVLMCGEHVSGDASGKPFHIHWQAFGLNEEADKTRQFYRAQFGRPPDLEDARSATWTFKGEHNDLRYSVRTPSAPGPWSGCPIQPTDFKSVVLVSNGTLTKGR